MPQDEQLAVLSELAAPAADPQPQHSREGEVGDRKEHPAILASGQRRRAEAPASRGQATIAQSSRIWYPRARVNQK
jgi:hypothetical protein